MQFKSLQPFVPSGSDLEKARQFFLDLGFTIRWDAGDYIGFENNNCSFILQHFNNKEFAENFMISVGITNANEFWEEMKTKNLEEKYGIKIKEPVKQPYGMEVNLIDLAGVCWHFVEQ